MRKIPEKLREQMAGKPVYKICLRKYLLNDHVCEADPLNNKLIDWEHTLIYGGNQINEEWAIIPICYWSHRGPGLKKEINVWIALNRASDEDLLKYSKAIDYIRERERLNNIYGIPIKLKAWN